MGKPSRELTLVETLSLTHNLYKSNFSMFFIPMLMVGIVNEIMAITAGFSSADPVALAAGWFTGSFLSSLVDLSSVVVFSGIASLAVGTLARAVCIKYASDTITKGHAKASGTLSFVMRKSISLLTAGILIGILVESGSLIGILVGSIGLGWLAFAVPSIILRTMFYLAVPVIIVENVGALGSLSRSTRLLNRRLVKTFFLTLLVMFEANLAPYLVISIISILSRILPLGFYSGFVTNILSSVAIPIIPISTTVHYYSMLVREQNPLGAPPSPK